MQLEAVGSASNPGFGHIEEARPDDLDESPAVCLLKRFGNVSDRRKCGHVTRPQGAARIRNLRDHPRFRIRRIAQQKVEVLVDSRANVFEHGFDSIDLELHPSPASLASVWRTR